MGIVTERDRNRIAALLLAIRPAHSIAARLEALSADDRAHYERWKERYDEWFKRCKARHDEDNEPDARPYACMLAGFEPPTLRRDIARVLFGESPKILNIEADAARKYKDFCDEQ